MREIAAIKRSTIAEIMLENPAVKEFFAMKGLPSDPEAPLARRLTLGSMLEFKRLAPEAFIAEMGDYLSAQRQLLRTNADAGVCDVFCRIPCVVQLPVENALSEYMREERLDLSYNIALVEFGSGWIDSLMDVARPPVLIGAGVEGMVKNPVLTGGAYRDRSDGRLNDDFKEYADPKGIFRFLSGIPLVFVVDHSRLSGRRSPLSWEALLSEEFHKSVYYPDDGHLLDGVFLAYVFSRFGEEGVSRFKNICIAGAHPSQMVRANGLGEEPAVMIMPHIFASIKAKQPYMEVIWPKEGAPIIPVLSTSKEGLSEEQEKALRFFNGPKFGQIFLAQGMFPSSHPDIDNRLPGPLWWIGWDYLYECDVLGEIAAAKRLFLGDPA